MFPGRLLQTLLQRLRAARLRALGADIGANCRLGSDIDIGLGFRNGGPGRLRIGEGCWIEKGVVLDAFGGTLELGRGLFVGPYTVVYGHGGVSIGDHTSIAMHCRIVSSDHGVPPQGELIQNQADVLKPCRIGRDVWLGAGVTVLGGVAIGDGCVVGAGAVVARDLPPYAIALGVPARVVKSRPSRA